MAFNKYIFYFSVIYFILKVVDDTIFSKSDRKRSLMRPKLLSSLIRCILSLLPSEWNLDLKKCGIGLEGRQNQIYARAWEIMNQIKDTGYKYLEILEIDILMDKEMTERF